MIKTAAVTVGTAATRLDVAADADYDNTQILQVRVPSDGVRVYIGGSDVTTANGTFVEPGETTEIPLEPGDQVFGRVASATQEVRVLQVGV